MDALPHFDQGSYRVSKSGALYLGQNVERNPDFDFLRQDWIIFFADFAIGGLTFLLLLLNLPFELWIPLMAGVFGCLLPDIIDSSPLWSRKLRAKYITINNYHKFHIYFHWTVTKDGAILGIATQIALIAVSLWYMLL